MNNDEYISGAQLRIYLHISTRKMKYLMDYDYIPHINTGGTTHRYLIKFSDAEKFKVRLETDLSLLNELKGNFSNRRPQKKKPGFTSDDLEPFSEYLTHKWRKKPDAISIHDVKHLTGIYDNTIRKYVRQKKIAGTIISNLIFVSKAELIAFLCSDVRIIHTLGGETMKRLVKGYLEGRESNS